MTERLPIRAILEQRNVALDIVHNHTTLEDVADKLSPFAQVVNILPLAGMFRDALARKGVKSTTKRSDRFKASYEKVIASVALAINKTRLDLQQMLDIDAGGYFEVAIPASVASGEGTLQIFVIDGEEIEVNAEVVIPGQMQAWEKGKTSIDNFFKAVDEYLELIRN